MKTPTRSHARSNAPSRCTTTAHAARRGWGSSGLLALGLLVAAAGARADTFLDFGVEEVLVSAVAPGSYVVSVSVQVSPGPLAPTQDITLEVVSGESTLVGATGVQTFGVPSTQCCSDASSCTKVDGYAVRCASTCPDAPPAHVCIYRTTFSFGPLPLPDGEIVTATLDAGALHTETDPGALLNNSAAGLAAPYIPGGAVVSASNVGVGEIRANRVSGGLYDVEVDYFIAPEVVVPSGSIDLQLLVNDLPVDVLSLDTSEVPVQICCSCDGACPSPPQGSVCCTGICTDAAQKQTAKCVCNYEGTATFASLALAPSDVLTALIDPNGEHIETVVGHTSDDSLTLTVALSVASASDFALFALALVLLATGAAFYRTRSSRGGIAQG